jgi:hypothetical protein
MIENEKRAPEGVDGEQSQNNSTEYERKRSAYGWVMRDDLPPIGMQRGSSPMESLPGEISVADIRRKGGGK